MAFQYSVAVRNAKLDQIEATVGPSAILKIFSGAEPANCAAADPAGLLATLTLPSDWMANAAAGVKAKAGSWSSTGSAAGTAASFRIYDSGLVACHLAGQRRHGFRRPVARQHQHRHRSDGDGQHLQPHGGERMIFCPHHLGEKS